MRFILLLLVALGFGYGLLQVNAVYPDNYVKIFVGSYLIEIRLLGFVLLAIGIVIVLYVLLRLFRLIMASPKLLSGWQEQRSKTKSEEKLGAGYLSLIKGDWRKAEAQLTAKTKHSNVAYINYLAAAKAAQEQGHIKKRDDYLALAHKAAPNEGLAIALTKAKLYQGAGQDQQALEALKNVAKDGQKNPQYTAMLIQSYEQVNDWNNVQALLPTAKKQHALPDDLLAQMEKELYLNTLITAEDTAQAWGALSKAQKKQIQNIEVYVEYLIKEEKFTEAEKLIRLTLKNDWSDDLANLYGKIITEKPEKLLRQVEGWLLAQPDNPQLLLAAGSLAMQDKQWDMAKKYLEKAIVKGHLPEAYSLLGKVYEANNEAGKALALYRSGMQWLIQLENKGLIADDMDSANIKNPNKGAMKTAL